VSTVCILVKVALDFFQEEAFEGRNIPLLQGINLISRWCYFAFLLLIFFSIYLFYFIITPSAK
jgi:hypothetical protein